MRDENEEWRGVLEQAINCLAFVHGYIRRASAEVPSQYEERKAVLLLAAQQEERLHALLIGLLERDT